MLTRHREAFEYYYSLGDRRSLVAVARQCGVSERSVARWSKLFNWQGRVEQRDIENARRLEKKTNEAVVEAKANYRKVVKAAIARWVENFRERSIEPGSVQDLERLIKMDLLFMEEDPETKKAEALQTWADIPKLGSGLSRVSGKGARPVSGTGGRRAHSALLDRVGHGKVGGRSRGRAGRDRGGRGAVRGRQDRDCRPAWVEGDAA